MTIITRFAPSPTGYLHIGGARTALFSYLFARRHNGKFLLRIEDTDAKRNDPEAVEAIFESMQWLGLKFDDEVVYQSKNFKRHSEVINILLEKGHAYKCYMKSEELDQARLDAKNRGENYVFRSKFRDNVTSDQDSTNEYVIRLKVPKNQEIIINDLVQGEVRFNSDHIEDFVLARSDGAPTYMSSVVVDDHDMGITHIIRGDDHLVNTPKQYLIYKFMEWNVPNFAHIPLIHGPDGSKLSKRHGATGVHEYKDQGYLPESFNSYLLGLGWSAGGRDYISVQDAIEIFSIEDLSKSPSRLDFDKLDNVNAHFLRELSADDIMQHIKSNPKYNYTEANLQSLKLIYEDIKPRIEKINDIDKLLPLYLANYQFNIEGEELDELKSLSNELLSKIDEQLNKLNSDSISNISELTTAADEIKNTFKLLAKEEGVKLNEIMKYIRIMLTGTLNTPGMFNLIPVIGKNETLRRLKFSAGLIK